MKNTKIIKFAIDNIIINIKKFIMSVLIFTISLLLVSFAIMSYQGTKASHDSLENSLSKGIKKTGIVSFPTEDFYSKKGQEYLHSVYNLSEIDSVGSCILSGNNCKSFEELKKIQNKYSFNDYLQVLFLDPTLFKLCNMNVQSGTNFEDLNYDEDYVYIYLGSKYSSHIKLNTIYKNSYGVKYKVVGFLKNNSKWIDPSIVNGFYMQKIDYSINLDYAVIMIENTGPLSDKILFSVSDGYSMNDAITKINKITKENGWDFSIEPLQSIYESQKGDSDLLMSYLLRIMGIVLFSSILMLTCMQIIIVISEKHSYGVYYAIGFSEKDITKIILWETIIKTFISFIISCIASVFVFKWWFSLKNISGSINEIFWSGTMPYVLLIAIFVTVITMIIPIYIFKHYSPAELIGGKND